MKELSAALRQFADRVEAGELLPGANQVAIVLANGANEVQAVYMGMQAPAARAGIFLLAAGIQRFNIGELATTAQPAAAPTPAAGGIFEDAR